MLLPGEDPVSRSHFAATEHELEAVSAYLETVKKLKLGKKEGPNNDVGDDAVAGEKRPPFAKHKK